MSTISRAARRALAFAPRRQDLVAQRRFEHARERQRIGALMHACRDARRDGSPARRRATLRGNRGSRASSAPSAGRMRAARRQTQRAIVHSRRPCTAASAMRSARPAGVCPRLSALQALRFTPEIEPRFDLPNVDVIGLGGARFDAAARATCPPGAAARAGSRTAGSRPVARYGAWVRCSMRRVDSARRRIERAEVMRAAGACARAISMQSACNRRAGGRIAADASRARHVTSRHVASPRRAAVPSGSSMRVRRQRLARPRRISRQAAAHHARIRTATARCRAPRCRARRCRTARCTTRRASGSS